MFGIGMPELLLILAIALIVIGPKKLPDIARSLGKGMAEFKRATDELKTTFDEESRAETKDRLVREGKIRAPGTIEPKEEASPLEEPSGSSNEPAPLQVAADKKEESSHV